MSRWLIEEMNAARALKPASGGKVYKRIAARRADPPEGTWERLSGITKARWECSSRDAMATFQFAVHGDSWEGF